MATTLNLGRVKGSFIYTGSGTDDATIKSDLSGRSINALTNDLYIGNNGKLWQLQSSGTWAYVINMKGAQGEGFKISKTYDSVTNMNAGFASDGVPEGGFVMISSNVEDPDNAKVYVKGASAYNFLVDLSGATGIKGEDGADGADGKDGVAATITIGTVTTGAAGSQAQVTNAGTTNAAKFNFVIPKGADGADGQNGQDGQDGKDVELQKTTTHIQWRKVGDSAWNDLVALSELKGADGTNGTNGQDGQDGEDGKTPTLSINEDGELVATFA